MAQFNRFLSIPFSFFCSFSPAWEALSLIRITGSCRICTGVADETQLLMREWSSEKLSCKVPSCFLTSSDGSLFTIRRSRLIFILWWMKKAGTISLRYSAPSRERRQSVGTLWHIPATQTRQNCFIFYFQEVESKTRHLGVINQWLVMI